MRASRAVVVSGASVALVTAGWAAAPAELDRPSRDGADGAGEAVEDPDVSVTIVDGPEVSNLRGGYQVQLHIEDGVVTDVEFPAAGTDASQSRQVNAMALPVLEERFLEAQSWDVEHVSGASYTSPAMVESARAAFEEAGL